MRWARLRPSHRGRRRLTRLAQLSLLGIVAYGAAFGHPKAVMNGSIALLVTLAPALLERNYSIPLDPWLALWLTLAVGLHAVGSAGLYVRVPWWDHLTHALSASLIAGVGYTVARAIDLHSDEIHLPHRFFFVFILVVVLGVGVLWELFEFGLDGLGELTGRTMPLSQHGLDDTVRDLLFNAVGAFLVATFGQARLSGVADRINLWRAED